MGHPNHPKVNTIQTHFKHQATINLKFYYEFVQIRSHELKDIYNLH